MDSEKDVGKVRFQQELSRWFESRGVISELRSHLRHLMISALQSSQTGPKSTDRSSPKAQALNLMVAEYLFRHGCHYTLSVFTSEVPTLANFNLEPGLQGRKEPDAGKKHPLKDYFKESEVEEIFNALGMTSGVEELALLKTRYLERGSRGSLIEFFLQTTVDLATKLQIQQNLDSHAVEGERVLSKEWSSKIVDVLLGEKMTPSQISAVQEAIFRITENEIRRSMEEQRALQMKVLSTREKRIQEYLRKHEHEFLLRLTEAEKELRARKDIMEEELAEREKHLTNMAVEWNNKHEEILRLSKKFHNIENENRGFKKKLKELEEENRKQKAQEESQSRRIRDLQEELDSLIHKLSEATNSNAILSERVEALMRRESKEDSLRHDGANQPTAGASVHIPLLWSKSKALVFDNNSSEKKESGPNVENEETPLKKQLMPHPDQWSIPEPAEDVPGDAEPKNTAEDPIGCESSDEEKEEEEEEDDVSLSSSFAGIIRGVHEKLQVLEEESNRLNQNYWEYKLKCISVDSDDENSNVPSSKSPSPMQNEIFNEPKFCQTGIDETFIKLHKLKETKEGKYELDYPVTKNLEVSPKKTSVRTPNKRQLQNREFFLKRLHLVQQLEKQHAEELNTKLDSSTCSSGENLTESWKETDSKSPAKTVSLESLKTTSDDKIDDKLERKSKSSAEGTRKDLVEGSNQLLKSDADCLALLEQARIKTPQVSARMPLRQQMLLSESEKEEADEEKE